jgi:hypothetical protein
MGGEANLAANPLTICQLRVRETLVFISDIQSVMRSIFDILDVLAVRPVGSGAAAGMTKTTTKTA